MSRKTKQEEDCHQPSEPWSKELRLSLEAQVDAQIQALQIQVAEKDLQLQALQMQVLKKMRQYQILKNEHQSLCSEIATCMEPEESQKIVFGQNK
jgi:hypothetical protein